LKIAIFTIFLILFSHADSNDTDIVYYKSYKTAQEEAQKEKKYLFIVITAEHCGWCKKLKNTTLKEREIIENLARDYIAVELDMNGYYPKSIEVVGVPSVIIVEPKSGEVIKNIVGFREDSNDYLKWFRYVKNLKE